MASYSISMYQEVLNVFSLDMIEYIYGFQIILPQTSSSKS